MKIFLKLIFICSILVKVVLPVCAQDEKKLDKTIIPEKLEKAEKILTGGEVDIDNTFAANGDTPLLKSIRYNSFDMFKLLIKHNADPNKANNKGETPILLAYKLMRKDCIKVLAQLKIDVSQLEDHVKSYVFGYAVVLGNDSLCMDILNSLRKDDVEKNTIDDLFLWVTTKGNEEMTQRIFDFNPNVNVVFESNSTIMHQLMYRKDLSKKELLLYIENGAIINELDDDGYTPLDIALHRAHADRIPHMIDQGAKTEVFVITKEIQEWLDAGHEDYLRLYYSDTSGFDLKEKYVKRDSIFWYNKKVWNDDTYQINKRIDWGEHYGTVHKSSYNKEGELYYEEIAKYYHGRCYSEEIKKYKDGRCYQSIVNTVPQ